MSDTPQTDDLLAGAFDILTLSNHAKHLERKLANMTTERDAAINARNEASGYLLGCVKHGRWHGMECIGCIEAERDALLAERNHLHRLALEINKSNGREQLEGLK